MARDADALNLITKWAGTGDVQTPEDAGLDRAEGWPVAYSQPGGSVPTRVVFNQMFRELSALAVELNTFGAGLAWDATLDYPNGATVLGSDLEIYLSRDASGPSTVVRDPITPANRPAFWQSLSEYIVEQAPVAGGGGGDVFGPASSINDGIAIYSGTTGKVLKASGKTIDSIQGVVLNQVETEISGSTTITAVVPDDNTTPTVSEGVQIFTLGITPADAANKVKIEVNLPFINSNSQSNVMAISVFRGSTNLGVGVTSRTNSLGEGTPLHLVIVDEPASASLVTYTVRMGVDQDIGYLHGRGGSAQYGSAAKSRMILSEIKV